MPGRQDRADVARLKARVTELEGLLEAQKSAATSQADRLEAALNQVNDQAAILRTIVASTATTGEEFFRSLVASLASTLDVRCAFVGEVMSHRPGRVRTLALWMDGELGETIEYALAGTPCEQIVTGRRMRLFSRGIRQQFPDDRFLADLGMESYLGFPLMGDAGDVVGLVGVIHDAPMIENSQAQSLLEVYASRVETELRRVRLVEALEKSEEKYRLLFSRAMDAVVLIDTDTLQFLDVNDVALSLYGYTRGEFLRLRVPDVSAEPDESIASIEQATRAGGGHIQLRWHKKKDGTVFPLEISCGPFAWKGRTMMCGVLRDITERKRDEAALRRTTEALRGLIQSSPLAIVTLDLAGNVTSWNPAAERFFGWREPEVIGCPLPYVPEGKERESDDLWNATMKGQCLKDIEITRLTKDGSLLDLSLWVTPVRDADGRVVSTMGVMADLSERKQQERTLRALVAATGPTVGEAFFQLLVSNLARALRVRWAFVGELRCSPSSTVKTLAVWADGRLHENFEYPLAGTPCERVLTDHRMWFYPRNVQALFPDDPALADWGVESYLAFPLLNGHGAAIGLLGVMHDAGMPGDSWGQALLQTFASRAGSELHRLRAHEALQESEARFRTIFESTNAGIGLVGADGRFLKVNEAMCRMVGYSKEELLAGTFHSVTHADDRERSAEMSRRMLAGEIDTWSCEQRYLHKHGHPVWGLVNTAAVRGQDGRPKYLIAMVQDLTSRIQADAALLESTTKFHAILDHCPAMVFLKDTEGRYLFTNRRFEQTFHLTREAILGHTDHQLFSPEQAATFAANDRRVFQRGMPMEFEEVSEQDDGPHTSIVVKFPLHNVEGTIYAIGGIATDITERQRLEEQLRQSQKIEAVGRLAGGIAHDFNNLLTVINGYSDLLASRRDLEDSARRQVAEIHAAGKRAADLTGQLLAFSRGQVIRPKVFDLNRLVFNLAEMLRRLIGEDVRLVTALATGPCAIKADPGQIEQVLVNLAVNARDAMPEGGTLTIETVPVQGETEGQVTLEPLPYVRVVVRDSGSGMDAETKAHVFEPFFTTKAKGQGAGLGLAMVYGIVTQNRGVVTVDSAPGQGATFTIYVPRVTDWTEPDAKADPPVPIAARGETILLVEDESTVRTMVHTLLSTWGYTVLTAGGGAEALERAAAHPGPIHLLLTDVIMPGMSGRQVADQVKLRWPETKILFMSGYTDDLAIRDGQDSQVGGFLQKPFAPESLQRMIRDLLDAPRE